MMDNPKRRLAGVKMGGAQFTTVDGVNPTEVDRLLTTVRGSLNEFSVALLVIGGGPLARQRQSELPEGATAEEKDRAGIAVTQENALRVLKQAEKLGFPIAPMIPKDVEQAYDLIDWVARKITQQTEKMIVLAAGGLEPGRSTDAIAVQLLLRLAERFEWLEQLQPECDEIQLLLAILSNVDGLYTADPKEDTSAQKIDRATLTEIVSQGLLSADPTSWEPGKKTPVDPVATALLLLEAVRFDTHVFYGHGEAMDDVRRFLLGQPTHNGTQILVK